MLSFRGQPRLQGGSRTRKPWFGRAVSRSPRTGDGLEELFAVPGGRAWATNEVLYNLSRDRGIPTMAYSTIEQGRLRSAGAVEEVAKKRGARPYSIALAWVMRRPDVIAIPKASGTEHVRENRRAVDI